MTKSVSKTAVVAVAAGAAASIGSNSALADQMVAAEPQWYLSLDGGAIFTDPAIDKLGSISDEPGLTITDQDDMGTSIGFRGAAAFGQNFNENWDWRVGVAFSNFMKNRGSVSFTSGGGGSGSGFGTLGETSDLRFLTGDLELGYNVHPSDNVDLRLFAGLRALSSHSSEDKFGTFSSGGPPLSEEFRMDTEFLGIGPRAGFDFSTRMGDGPFGISGMAAGSILFGRIDQEATIRASMGGSSFAFTGGDDQSETVYNIEAALGADVHITDNSVLTIGYRAEYWDNMRGEDKSGSGDEFDGDVLSHGPFVRFIANF